MIINYRISFVVTFYVIQMLLHEKPVDNVVGEVLMLLEPRGHDVIIYVNTHTTACPNSQVVIMLSVMSSPLLERGKGGIVEPNCKNNILLNTV